MVVDFCIIRVICKYNSSNMHNDIFSETILRLAGTIWEKYNTIFGHPWDMGDTRELKVIEFLEKIFPNKYWFSRWEIFDVEDQNCGQVDVIIYDKLFSLTFSDWTDKILSPMDSTYWIIEIKSTLTTTTLKDALDKIDSYSILKRQSLSNDTLVVNPDFKITFSDMSCTWPNTNIPFNCIFAYDNKISFKTLHDILLKNSNIDLLIVPNKFVYFCRSRGDVWIKHDNNLLSNWFVEDNRSIWLWILYMQLCLSRIHLIGVDKSAIFINFLKKFKYQYF